MLQLNYHFYLLLFTAFEDKNMHKNWSCQYEQDINEQQTVFNQAY